MTLKFKDVSHWNGSYKPTGPTIAKATEGTSYIDPEFSGIRARAKAAGFPFLPYHFLAHGSIPLQVAHVISVVGDKSNLMLDVEAEAGKADPTLADVLAFTDAYAKKSSGRVVLAYIPKWFWSGHWKSPSLAGLPARRVGLVSSEYTRYSDSGPGWDAYGGVHPIVWQFTSTPIDTNAFKGSAAQLVALFSGTTVPESTTSEDDMLATDKLKINPALFGGDDESTVGQLIVDAAEYALVARNNSAAVLAIVSDPAKLAALLAAATAGVAK